MSVRGPDYQMTLNQLDPDIYYTSDLSSESSATGSSSYSVDADHHKPNRLPVPPSLRKNHYCSDSDSGIVAVPYSSPGKYDKTDTLGYGSANYEIMSPKDTHPMIQSGHLRSGFASDSSQSNQENEFWKYDEQSLLSEESVRKSCHQIYSTLQRNSLQKSSSFEQYRCTDRSRGPYVHGQANFVSQKAPNNSIVGCANSLMNTADTHHSGSSRYYGNNASQQTRCAPPSLSVSTLPKRTASSRMMVDDPKDIIHVFARPASVVPEPAARSKQSEISDYTLPRNDSAYNYNVNDYSPSNQLSNSTNRIDHFPPASTINRHSNDFSRISLVSMDQKDWRNHSDVPPQYSTPMFKSQPCLTTFGSEKYNYGYSRRPPNSQNQLLTREDRYVERVKCEPEAFGTLNVRNRAINSSKGPNDSPVDSVVKSEGSERRSRENHCKRSKSFADKIHRGSQSFRSACSAFRRAFSQERIYRPEKQERQQQELINLNAVPKSFDDEEKEMEREGRLDRSLLLTSGRQIVNGIREKLGGSKDIIAHCNTYTTKLAVHKRRPKHIYQPPLLVNNPERMGYVLDGVDGHNSILRANDGFLDSGPGWFKDPSSPDYNQRVWGHLIQLNVDGSQVIELSRPQGFHFGFFVARGRVKESKGVFVSRMRDVITQKTLAGILEVGDEILEIEGVDVRGADILTVNAMMAHKQTLLLTVLPYISRKDI